MVEEQRYRGRWWLPDVEDQAVCGEVVYSPEDGITLDLFTALDRDPMNRGTGRIVQFERIFGYSDEGESITVIGCTRNSYSGSSASPGAGSATHEADYLFVGDHLERADPAFTKLKVGFPLLEEWAQLASPRNHMDMQDPPRVSPGDKTGVLTEIPESEEASIDGTTVKLGIGFNTHTKMYGQGEVALTARFTIEAENLISFTAYLDHIKRLRDFITFGMGRPVQPRAITGYLPSREQQSDVSVEVFHLLSYSPEGPDSIHPSSTMFQRSDIEESFDETLNQWYEMTSSYEPVIDLYLGTQYNPRMYVQNTFLSLTQAIESYHRRAYNDRYLNEKLYGNLRSNLDSFLDGELVDIYGESLDSSEALSEIDDRLKTLDEIYDLPSGLKSKLHSMFKHANEYSLRKRLREIVSDHQTVLESLPYNISERQHEIIVTRNQLTHQDTDPDAEVADRDELTTLSWGLEQLIEVCLLSDLGLPEEHITDRLQTRYRDRRVL